MNVLMLAILLTTAAPAFEIQTLDGQTLVGPLVELSADRVTVDASGGRVSIESDKLVSIAAKEKPPVPANTSGLIVELADGSTIYARQYTAQGSLAKITLPDGLVLESPLNAVRTVQFEQKPGTLSAEWNRLVKMNADSDLLMFHKGDNLDYQQGVLRDVTEDAVQFDLDGELLPVKRTKVFGFVYRHRVEATMPAAVCRITDVSGSQWAVRSLSSSDKMQWTTPSGIHVSLATDKIAQIDFSGGKIVFLSDLKPESVRWTPFFGAGKSLGAVERFYAPRYDRNFDGGPLLLSGVTYKKGLALHCRTETVYRLPDRFSRFMATAGIDDAVRPGGKARLIVRGDDNLLLDTVITGADLPKAVDLDLTGVRRLTIIVDFGDTLNAGDYLLLCNARLRK